MHHTRPADCQSPQYSDEEMPKLMGKESGWSQNELQSKHPMPYSIPQNVASPELKHKMIDRDRNKMNNSVDHLETGPSAKFEDLQRAADESGSGRCEQPMRRPGDPYRVRPKPGKAASKTISKQGGAGNASDPRAKRGPSRVGSKPGKAASKRTSKQGGAGTASDPRAKSETTSAVPFLDRTEYQDTVSKQGGIIMRDSLHRTQNEGGHGDTCPPQTT